MRYFSACVLATVLMAGSNVASADPGGYNSRNVNQQYYADTDGFVVAWISYLNNGDSCNLYGQISTSGWTTVAKASLHYYTPGNTRVGQNSIMFPVAQGSSYQALQINTSGNCASGMYWIPAVGPAVGPALGGYGVHFGTCTAVPNPPAHGYAELACPNGQKILGGGVGVFSDSACTVPSGAARITYSGFDPRNTSLWVGDVVLSDIFPNWYQVQVTCAN